MRPSKENKDAEEKPLTPDIVPSELIGEWSNLRYQFEVAKFQEHVERARRLNAIGIGQTQCVSSGSE